MEELKYQLEIQPLSDDDGGGYLVTVPDLPGCMADGATPEEAIAEARDAIKSWLATARKFGDPIPEPGDLASCNGTLTLRIPVDLHRRLKIWSMANKTPMNQGAAYLLAHGLGQEENRT